MRAHLVAAVLVAVTGVAQANTGISSSVAPDAGLDPSAQQASVALVKETLDHALSSTLLQSHHVDISIANLSVVIDDQNVSVTATMRIAIADQDGKLLTVMSGGARVEVPNSAYRSFKLPAMQRDALVGAVEGLAPKVATLLANENNRPVINLNDLTTWFKLPMLSPRPSVADLR